MAGIKDVADAAGVSAATVSRALRGLPHVSEETRTRIVRLADELGYVPSSTASGLRSGHTMAISIVVPSVNSWFYASVLDGADAELRRAGYDMVLFNLGGATGERERLFHSSILRKRGDALLALCIDFTEEEREQLSSIGLPSVIVGGPVRDLRYVGIDEVETARLATQHLIDLGHRDILFIGGGAEAGMGLNARVPRDRRHGYERAMRAAGLPRSAIRSIEGEFSTAVSRRRTNELLDAVDEPPTAVFAASDEMAIGAMLALYDHGLAVPADVSVIGIDGHPLAESFGLTTMAQHPFAQGAMGARLLLDELEGTVSRRRALRLPVELVVRTSTAPPPARPALARGAGEARPTPAGRPDDRIARAMSARIPRAERAVPIEQGVSPPPAFAVIVPALDHWFHGRVIEGVEEALLAAGREMALYIVGSPADREPVLESLLAQAPFGGVIAVGMQPGARGVEALRGLGGPVIAVGSPSGLLPSIAIDHEAAAQFATEHLLSLGHTDIVHLAGTGAGSGPETIAGLRLHGFRRAMAAAGLDPTDREWAGDMSMPGGYAVGRRLLGDPRRRPTAIFAACDEMAFGAIVAAREFGISIPNELSVIGIDGHDSAEMFSLTTLLQSPAEQGRRAAELLLTLPDAGRTRAPETIEFPFRLVVRSSTTAPRH